MKRPDGKLLFYKGKMAHPKRFELLTPRFVVWCSIQLSYGCACLGGEGGSLAAGGARRKRAGEDYLAFGGG